MNKFSKVGAIGRLHLRREFQNLRHNFRDNLSDFFTKFDSLITHLETSGSNVCEEEKLTQLLIAMLKEYFGVLTAVETMCAKEKDIDVEFVKNRLLKEESRPKTVDERNNGHNMDVAFITCYQCGKKGTIDTGLKFFKKKNEKYTKLVAFTDADFAGDEDTRRSTSGFVLTLYETPISWFSRRQSSVSLLTAEAEGVKEVIVMKRLLTVISDSNKVEIKVNNQSALRMLSDETTQKRTKHIDVKTHFIKEKTESDIVLNFVNSESQFADIFIKALPKIKFRIICENLNIKRREC